MKTMRIVSAALILSINICAWADMPMPPTEEGYDFESSSTSTAVGTGVGIGLGVGIGEGGNAQSSADAVASGGDANAVGFGGEGGNSTAVGLGGDALSIGQGGNSSQTQGQSTAVDTVAAQKQNATASNEGNNLNTSFSSSDKAFAIGLSAATAAPIDSSICRVKQTAGWDVRIVARTGRNVFDADCLSTLLSQQTQAASFNRCMDIVQMYVRLNVLEAAAKQLEKCGGVEIALVRAEMHTKTLTQHEVTERIERAFQATQSK